MRWVALFCVLLFGAASTAQAAHVHASGALSAAHAWQTPAASPDGTAGDEHCPLCVALHAALPAAIALTPAPLLARSLTQRSCEERDASADWHFPSFSRPPPRRG